MTATQNKVLIVVGMHRSGTSLITRWLHSCGLPVGEDLLGPGLGNNEGHFEDTAFYDIHLQILRDNGLHDSGIMTEPVWRITAYRKEEIRNIIAEKNSRFEQWGWKDPRTCLWLDVYREMLPDAHYLVVLRDYQSVIVSLLNRTFALIDITYNTRKGYFSKLAWYKFRRKRQFQKFCKQHASTFLAVWVHYNELILKGIRSLPADKYLVINYEILHKEDKRIISHLNKRWHFSLNHSRFSDIYNEKLFSKPFAIEQFINDEQLILKAKKLFTDLSKYINIRHDKVVGEYSITKVLQR